jgi:hypothetical protein
VLSPEIEDRGEVEAATGQKTFYCLIKQGVFLYFLSLGFLENFLGSNTELRKYVYSSKYKIKR